MEIREIESSELAALLALYKHLHRKDDPLPGGGRVAAVWTAIQEDKNHRCYGVFVEGEMVAACSLILVQNLTRGCRSYGVIENVVTHEKYRRRGLGKAVLLYALEQAWATDCYKVMLMTGRKDPEINAFYTSAGFADDQKQAFLARPV